MQVLGKLLMQWVVMPLTRDLAKWLWKQAVNGYVAFKEYLRKRKLKKKNKAKVTRYENADNSNDANDSFGELP